MDALSVQQLEQKAMFDHMEMLGKTIRPKFLYNVDRDVITDGRVLVRIRQILNQDLRHWCDEWLDPVWDIDIVDDPDGLCKPDQSYWVYGPSYNLKTGECQPLECLEAA